MYRFCAKPPPLWVLSRDLGGQRRAALRVDSGPSFLLLFAIRSLAVAAGECSSRRPVSSRMRTQAEAFVRHMKDSGLEADIVMHDRDNKFSEDFDQMLKDAKLRVQKAAFRSPNTVAFVERFIQALQQECLDYFVVFGEEHLR